MTEDTPPNPALLPTGLADLLPPEAETEAAAVAALMAVFASHGYERVKPPLLEFADGLLAGSGAAVADQTFRVMDPATSRMLGLRADMTPQVARIAASRLAGRPRPLRLSYAGQCLRVAGNLVDPNRQVAQAGIELIGADSPAADAEMILLAAEALAAVGLERFSFDLTMPTLAPALLTEAGIEGATRAALTRALDRKDTATVAEHGGVIATMLTDLLLAAGPAEAGLAALEKARMGPLASAQRARIALVVAQVQARAPTLRLTLDPLEFRGFRYHTGLCITAFAPGRTAELARGGRYISGDSEPATGLTLFPDPILRVCATPAARPRAYVPWESPPAEAANLRAGGYATIPALEPGDAMAEAIRLGCTHLLQNGEAIEVKR